MISSAHRGLALLILLLTLATLGGVVSTAAALAAGGRADVCCDRVAPTPETNPCADECSCISCLSLVPPALPELAVLPSPGTGPRTALIHLHLSTFVASIDYPPEAV